MSKKKKINAITEFALAEFGSAVEMLQAAKLAPDAKMAAGFIDHAVCLSPLELYHYFLAKGVRKHGRNLT